MFTITTTKTTDGSVVSQFKFIRFSEAYTSFVERCNERDYEYEWDSESDTWTGGGRGNDNTITINKQHTHMKNFEVTLLLVVNASRDIELSTPETKQVVFNVDANSEHEARVKAKEQDTSGLSVWESYSSEN